MAPRTERKTTAEWRWLIKRWATARTPARRLGVLVDLGSAMTADDRYGDTDHINDLLDRNATELHRQLKEAIRQRSEQGAST